MRTRLRSTANYASYAAVALNLRLTDVSCASATTDNIVIGPQRRRGRAAAADRRL